MPGFIVSCGWLRAARRANRAPNSLRELSSRSFSNTEGIGPDLRVLEQRDQRGVASPQMQVVKI